MPASHLRPTARRRPVVVLDTDPSWSRLVVGGHVVESVDPTTVSVTRLLALDAPRVLCNLAAPTALEALARLRGEGLEQPVWGTIAVAGTAHAIGLGRIEPVLRPFDATLARQALLGHVPLDARVLCAGSDAAGLLAFRAALVADGASVSLAWTGGQAADLLGMMRPEVVLVDLALPPHGGHELVLRLAEADAFPLLMLRAGAGDDAAAFRRAARSHPHRHLLRPRVDVLAETLQARPVVQRGLRRPQEDRYPGFACTG